MEKQVEVYIDQMKINVKNAKLYYGFILCGIAFTFVIIFYFMSHAYDGVAKRKESYLQVFFEIGNSVIKASLEKCENFTKKIQAESASDYLSSDSGDDLSEENIVIEKPNTSKEKTRKFQKSNISKDTKIFRIKLVICLFLIGVFSLLLYLFYWRHIDNLFIYLLFYRNFVELVNTYIMLFNGLREYMFEPEGTIMYMKASEYLSQSLENIYIVRKNKQAYINEHLAEIPGDFQEIYSKINSENSCDNMGEYFSNEEECQHFTDNSTSFGLSILMSYFVENIRQAKNRAIKNEEGRSNTSFIFNLTLANTEIERALWPSSEEDKIIYGNNLRINNFNCDDIHLRLLIIFNNLVYPSYIAIISSLTTSIKKSLDNNKFLYILLISGFIGIILLCYTLLFIPFESRLNQTIYKTKNMLSIIPKEVLASLDNIQQLLDIGLGHQQLKKTR